MAQSGSNPTKNIILGALAVICVGFAVWQLGRMMDWWGGEAASPPAAKGAAPNPANGGGSRGVTTPPK